MDAFYEWLDKKFYEGFHEGLGDLTDEEYYELEDWYRNETGKEV